MSEKIRGYGATFWKSRNFAGRTSNERAEAGNSSYSAAVNFLKYIWCLWLSIIRRSSQGVWFMKFPSHTFFNDINHSYGTAILKKSYLWLLPSYIAVATYWCYEKVRRTMRTAIVSYLLKHWALVFNVQLHQYHCKQFTHEVKFRHNLSKTIWCHAHVVKISFYQNCSWKRQ